MTRPIHYIILIAACCLSSTLLPSCSSDIDIPSLRAPESVALPQGTTLSADRLFGVWEANVTTDAGRKGTASGSSAAASALFDQQYRLEFQSVDDAEALLSHWFVDATTTIRDSVCNLEYTYSFDGTTVELTPKAAARNRGAVRMKAVHTADGSMALYSVSDNAASTAAAVRALICSLTRTGDPEPSVTAVNRTLPEAGETVELSGRNLQFVDRLFLPTAAGETEVTDFTKTSQKITFTMPAADCRAGYIRCQASGAKVSAYSPIMFCNDCIFFHNFSTQGTSRPYTGTEFENTIDITQSLLDKVVAVSSSNLPDGHALTLAPTVVISPDSMLCFQSGAPAAWPLDSSLDPSTGSLRFSFGDRIQHVIDHSNGLITPRSKCSEVAIEMDIYVYSDGEPLWNTGFMSFRLDKDQGKSLGQSWFAQTAMWSMEAPVSFAGGWQTYTIPLSAFAITASEAYATVGSLASFLVANKKQAIIKLLNYQLDSTHPARALSSFQFCLANMRLVPYGVPSNTR